MRREETGKDKERRQCCPSREQTTAQKREKKETLCLILDEEEGRQLETKEKGDSLSPSKTRLKGDSLYAPT